MRVMWVLIALTVAVLLFAGCSGTVPLYERPLTADERAELVRIAEFVASVGPRWEPYAAKVLALMEVVDVPPRICIGHFNGDLAWAQWRPFETRILFKPAWFCGCVAQGIMWDHAAILVVEAAHIIEQSEDVHHLQREFLDDVYEAWDAQTQEVLP